MHSVTGKLSLSEKDKEIFERWFREMTEDMLNGSPSSRGFSTLYKLTVGSNWKSTLDRR